MEETPEKFIEKLILVFNEVYRILKPTGTCFVNLGDTYMSGNIKHNDIKPKSLCCVPDRFKIAMVDCGWICRNEIIWHKPNKLPESVKDRFTVDYEKIFFFVKNSQYYFKQQFEPYSESTINDNRWVRVQAGIKLEHTRSKDFTSNNIKEPNAVRDSGWESIDIKRGRNKRSVWGINTKGFYDAHFAVFCEELIYPMIDAGCPENGIVLDPFMGSGTTAIVAIKQNKQYLGIELNPEYIEIAEKRIANEKGLFA